VTFYMTGVSSVWTSSLPTVSKRRIVTGHIHNSLLSPASQSNCFDLTDGKGETIEPRAEFSGFPFFAQSNQSQPLTINEVRLVSSYVAWTITQNKDFFASVLS